METCSDTCKEIMTKTGTEVEIEGWATRIGIKDRP